MNVSLENIDKVTGLLTVKLEKADYQDKVEKSIKDIRKKAQIPGFRKGKVPAQVINKMYGKSILVEEVNKILSEQLYGYIKDNNISILGEPLPNKKKKDIDFETMEDFEFCFDLALAPELKGRIDKRDKLAYYNIEVSEEMIDNQVSMYTQRTGSYEKVDVCQEKDMLKGAIAELDAEGQIKEDGIKVDDVVLMPAYIKDEKQKEIFKDAKVNDVLTFNPSVAYDKNSAEVASLLKIEKEVAENLDSNFSYQITEITRFVPGEVNQALFDEIYGEGVVKSEEEFRNKVKEELQTRLTAESDYKFLLDLRTKLLGKEKDIEFPDALLKRMMLQNNPDKDEKFVEENYEKSIEELTWHLIKEKLVNENEIKVEQEEILSMAKEATKAQFAQYGMTNIPDDILANYSQEMLKKKETVEGLVNRVVENKLAAVMKDKVTLSEESITLEEFNKLFD